MRKTALVFAPHPDDVEFGCSYYLMALLEQGYRVVQVSMTLGEFGTSSLEFKGKRIAKIRAKELDQATKVFEDAFETKIDIVRLGYTDGYLPLTLKVRDEIIALIKQYNPNIIFAPDPWYSVDHHFDHLNTGRLVTFALKKISPTLDFPIPLIYYYSYKQDKYIPVKSKYLKILYNALRKHQSQVSPFAVKVIMGMIICIFLGKNFPRFGKLAKGYRTQVFNHKNELILPPKFEENALLDRIKYYLYHYPALKAGEMLHNISPEEIGLEIKK